MPPEVSEALGLGVLVMMVGIANVSIILVILLSMFQFFIPVIFSGKKKDDFNQCSSFY